MLYPVAELTKDCIGHIERILGDKIDTNAFRTNQSYHLLNFIKQSFWWIIEKQVGFVKEEDNARIVRVANRR